MKQVSRYTFFIIVSYTLVWSSALAQTRPKVIVPPSANPDSIEAKMLDRIRFYLSKDRRFNVANNNQVAAFLREKDESLKLETKAIEKQRKQADKLLKNGWKDYKELRIKTSVKKLEQAKIAFRKLFPYTLDMKNLLTCHLHLGIAYITSGKKTRGEQEIRQMILLDPARATRKLNKRFYTPETINTYQKIRDDVLAGEKARVIFTTTPPNAKVWFNGQAIKSAMVEGVPEGEHLIVIDSPGYKKAFKAKYIVAGTNKVRTQLEKKMTLTQSEYFLPVSSAYDFSQEVAGFLDDMSVGLNADIIFFYKIIESANNQAVSIEGQIYDQRTQKVSATYPFNLTPSANIDAAAKALVDKLVAHVDNRGYVVAELKVDGPKTAKDGNGDIFADPDTIQPTGARPKRLEKNRPWYKKWWFYAAVGAGAAAVGSIFLFTDAGKSDATDSTIRIDNPSL